MPSASAKPFSESVKLLTIAIPHFKDEAGLLSTIRFLAKEDLSETEVIVSDNGSGVNFEKTEPKLYALIGNIKIFKNRRNLGYDKNLDIAVSKSTGKFVWLLGCGDKPAKGCLHIVIKTLKANPDASSLLLHVQTSKHNTDNDLDTAFTKISAENNSTYIENLYNSALSGNVVNRQQWLVAATRDLQFENWCHIERSLQMHADTTFSPYSLRANTASVTVKRQNRGWWNQDDGLFLFNVLMHREVIKHYHHVKKLRSCKLPEFCGSPSKTIIGAILYSRSIAQQATLKTHQDNCKMLEQTRLHYAVYRLVNLIPKTILRSILKIVRSLKS
mgnify:FL=1